MYAVGHWSYTAHNAFKETTCTLLEIHQIPSAIFNPLAPGKCEWNFRHVIFNKILVIDGWGISCEIALIWMSLDFTDDQSTLVQAMAWSCQATSHYLSQYWPSSLSPYGVTRAQWVNTLRPSKMAARWHLKLILLNENVCISIEISLKFVTRCPINNILALVQIMAWRRPGDKPLSEPMVVTLLSHICVTRPQWVKIPSVIFHEVVWSSKIIRNHRCLTKTWKKACPTQHSPRAVMT